MERKAAVIDAGVVSNVIVVDDQDQQTINHFGCVLLPDGSPVCAGWVYDGTTFAPPPKYSSIEEAKRAKRAQIEQDRDIAMYADISAHGMQFQADKRSQDMLGQVISLAQAGLPLPPVWRAADNADFVVGALSDLLVIAGTMAEQVQVAYAKSWALKAQVDAATTIAEVEAVTW